MDTEEVVDIVVVVLIIIRVAMEKPNPVIIFVVVGKE
jgi:hypothetical protein